MTGYQSKKKAAQAKLAVDREQIEQWLEALESDYTFEWPAMHRPERAEKKRFEAISTIKEALAQPEQEPDDFKILSDLLRQEVDRLIAAKPAPVQTNCRHCGGPDNVLCAGQCKQSTPPAQPAQEPDVVMHCDSHTWTINNPPPKGSGDVNLYYAPAKEKNT
jgi:hypothetical protein